MEQHLQQNYVMQKTRNVKWHLSLTEAPWFGGFW